MNPLIQFRETIALSLIALLLACFALPHRALAVSPAPDGGYPGGNTAEGQNALLSLTTGTNNTAVGWLSLRSVTTGQLNTAVGAGALSFNTGNLNTATGGGALFSNNSGFQNTASGALALFHNTTGDSNTATGIEALFNNTTGNINTALGAFALESNTTGGVNTAIGVGALHANTTGFSNTALGTSAGFNVITANNVTCIGANVGGADVSNTTWIANVYGVTTQNGTTAPVIVSADGQLGTVASSERFKKDIATMEKASEAILSLRPVTFHYKTDTKRTPQFGLIAEEVAQVNPDLVIYDRNGEPYTVRYEAVNAMLLNEFLKEHRNVQELQATVAEQQKNFESKFVQQQKQIEVLTAGLQKVSAQVEMIHPAPPMVVNSR